MEQHSGLELDKSEQSTEQVMAAIGSLVVAEADPNQLRFTLDEVPVPTPIPQDSLF